GPWGLAGPEPPGPVGAGWGDLAPGPWRWATASRAMGVSQAAASGAVGGGLAPGPWRWATASRAMAVSQAAASVSVVWVTVSQLKAPENTSAVRAAASARSPVQASR